MGKIDEIIKEKGLTPKDCEYHTRRLLENDGKIRVLVIKGIPVAYAEYKCPKCGHEGYSEQEYKKVSKASKIRLRVECEKCHLNIKVDKLKGKKEKKK